MQICVGGGDGVGCTLLLYEICWNIFTTALT